MVIINNVKALVDDGATLDAKRTLNVLASVDYPFLMETTVSDLLRGSMGSLAGTIVADMMSFNANFNLPTKLFNTWVRSQAKASAGSNTGTTVAGSIDFIFDMSNIAAKVGDNVNINQNVTYRDPAQTVNVEAWGGW